MRFLKPNVIALLLLTSIGFSQIPDGYYTPAEGLNGPSLKAALNSIISGHTSFPYTDFQTDCWDILKETDKDPNNPDNVILLYTGWSVNAAQEYNNENGWSREHVWAKSRGIYYTGFGSEDDVAATDVHHLRPADITVNSARNNRWFDYCSIPYIDDGDTTGSFTSTDQEWVWQPRAEVVGDVARMMFYMATRYEGVDSEPDLELINYFPNDRYTNEPVFAKLSTLLAWHSIDPVDEFEQNRNNVIYGYQGNRNPFIDHPEYVNLLWNGETVVSFDVSATAVYEDNGTFNVDVTIDYPDSISATSVDVDLQYTNAIPGIDYEMTTPQTLTFPAGSYEQQSFSFLVLDDTEIDGPDTLLFELSNVSGGNNTTIGNPSLFQLVILDNEIAGDGRTGNIIISEIVDGPYSGGKPKIVEITNTGTEDSPLTGYTVSRFSGGSSTPDETHYTFPEFILPFGKSVVLTNTSEVEWNSTITELSMPEYVIFDLDYGFGPIIGNGDDTYELKDDTGTILDYYGDVGVDGTGLVWEYLDSYAYRNADVITGTDGFNPSEWTIGAVDALDNQQGNLHNYLTPGIHDYESEPVSLNNAPAIPSGFLLQQNYPNPFNPSTTIRYALHESANIQLTIFDFRGHEVVKLKWGETPQGNHSVQWDGLNHSGTQVATGVYFVQLKLGKLSQTIKVSYLK
ncbi:MAG: endonuclease [FCB group bacterium]|nr:endonuclease [FCB group bacterium]MBL7026995.1 endonuclease [Candidatus Neomarinimicrobiota bacterium]MBL7122175.1 endonuclease [Candidatus Neomarinimicrobiota bacterium]